MCKVLVCCDPYLVPYFCKLTVEPPNKGYYGVNDFVACREAVPILEVMWYTKVLAWG